MLLETINSPGYWFQYCNCCSKNITSNYLRVQCNRCPDFDLCVECFATGVEVPPHESDHSYSVMTRLDLPIVSPDWSADQELQLLKGLKMFGPSNWAAVAEHVATKSEEECIKQYRTYHLNTPNCLPLKTNPDEPLVIGKGKGYTAESNSIRNVSELVKARATTADSRRVKDYASAKSYKRGSSSSAKDLNGYNPKRHEFDVEYDNDAEKLLVDLEFNENDSEIERELKLRIVGIYNKRLAERTRRKDFIIERGLLFENPIEKDFTPEEKAICRKYDPFMRFHSKEEHNELLKIVVEESRTIRRIQELKEAKAAGFNSLEKVNMYAELNRRLVAGEKARLSNQNGSTSGPNMAGLSPGPSQRLSAVDCLSKAEMKLCLEIGFTAELYLEAQELMVQLILKGKITKKNDTYAIFERVEPRKLDIIYDMVVKKGFTPPS